MNDNKEFFSDMEEDLDMHIEMGDDGRYRVRDISTVTFQRDFSSRLTLKDVMYVLCLKKNLVFVEKRKQEILV